MRTGNVMRVVEADLCHGCGVCVAVCPVSGAIRLAEVADEVQPAVDPSVCTECGLCLEVCSGRSVDFEQLVDSAGITRQRYAPALGYFGVVTLAWSRNPEIRWRGSSGGVITAVLLHALEEGLIDGALVVRMRATSQGPRAEDFIARSPEGLLTAMGSKYIQAPLASGLHEILQREGRYAVVGLPCAVESLRKAERLLPKLRRRVVMYLGMACHANLNMQASQFIAERICRHPVAPESITDIRYRGSGWPGRMCVQINHMEPECVNYRSISDYLFSLHLFQVRRCSMCIDHVAELADISCGDAWLPRVMNSDKVGTSFAVIRSARGRALWDRAVADGVIEEGDLSVREAIRTQRFGLHTKKVENSYSIHTRERRGLPIPDYRYYGHTPLLDLFKPGLTARAGVMMKRITASLSKRGYPGSLGRVPDSLLRLGLNVMAVPVLLGESKLYHDVVP